MMGIDNIKKSARSLGACEKIESITSISQAIELMFSPQGREFALKTDYPYLDVWRENKDAFRDIHGIYIDTTNIVVNNHNVIAVGDAEVSVTLNGTDRLYHIIAMHGAKIKLYVKNYAVATVTSVKATIEIFNDNTAAIDIENTGIVRRE